MSHEHWLSVTRMPPHVSREFDWEPAASPWVLVALSGGELCIARLEAWPEDPDEQDRWVQWGRDRYSCEPTHWMPLPSLPEKETDPS